MINTQNSSFSPVLPDDMNEALRKMILLCDEIIKASETESNAVAMGWDAEFLEATAKKQSYALLYQKSCKEILARADEFKAADDALISKFTKIQKILQATSRTNITVLEPFLQKLKDEQKPTAVSG